MTRTRLLIRLEPQEGADLGGALAARTWDPLWMLARQRQMGELLGVFGGSPISCAARGRLSPLAHYRPGPPPPTWPDPPDASVVALDDTAPPLAVLAEAQPVRTAPRWPARTRATTGLRLADELTAEGVPNAAATLAQAYPLSAADPDDPVATSLLRVLTGRAPDGLALYRDLAAPVHGPDPQWALPAPLRQLDGVAEPVRTAAARWIAFCDKTVQEPAAPPAWNPAALAHELTVAAPTGDPQRPAQVLAATHTSEELDWYSFDLAGPRTGSVPGAPQDVASGPRIPTALRFPGMPTPRWWEMDDAAVDLGAVDASAADLARLLVLEYALAYGNDFFIIPLRLPVDSLTTITETVARDTFGATTPIPPAASAATPEWASWRMFTLTERGGAPAGAAPPPLLLLGRVADPVVADPVDEGQLVRDEMANLVWLIESRYQGQDGFPVRRSDRTITDLPTPPPAPPDAQLQWTLSVTPPAHWIPYAPQPDPTDATSLARASSRVPKGNLADAIAPSLPDRVLPREGIRVLREHAHARDASGQPYAWARFQRRVGRGETSSGLAYDAVRPKEPS
jgi:hypothetical protein